MINLKIKNNFVGICLQVSFFLPLMLFLSGCSDKEPTLDECVAGCQSVLEAKFSAGSSVSPQNVTDNIVVYLDASKSMRGYISPRNNRNFAVAANGQSIYTKTLFELKNAASLISPDYGVSLRRVTQQLSEPADALELSTGAIKRDDFYQGDDTDLALAVKSFPQKLKTNESGPPKFHILVTDGVQSSRTCTQSSDPRCLREQILNLIGRKEANWSLTVLGLRSEFDGLIHSEVLPGTSFEYESGKSPAAFRPFYLYIFSASQDELNQFVASLKERLLKLKPANVKEPDFLREFPVTNNFRHLLNGNIITTSALEKESSLTTLTTNNVGEDSVFTVKVSTDTEDSGPVRFTITTDFPWKLETELIGTKKELSELIKWELHQCSEEPAESRYAFVRKLDKTEYDDEGRTTITLETGWTKGEGNRGWRTFVLIGRVNTDKVSPKWITDWSTPTDTGSGEASKTLNLIESFGNLWKNAAIQKQVVAKIYLQVGEM